MLEFLIAIVPLVRLIYVEYMSHEANIAKADKKFKLDQDTLLKIVNAAVDKWNESNRAKSIEAKSAWDAADNDTRPSPLAPVLVEVKPDTPSDDNKKS